MALTSTKQFNLALGAQSSWNTVASSFSEDLSYPGGYGVKLSKPNQGSYPTMGTTANTQYYEGIKSVGGSINGSFAPDCASSQFLLASLFSSNTVTGSAAYTHVYSGDIQVPSYGFSANYTSGGTSNNLTLNHLGLFLSSFEIAKPEDGGPITFSTEILGVSESGHGATRTGATPAVVPYYNGGQATLELKVGENAFTSMTTIQAINFTFGIQTGVELRNGSGSVPASVAQGKPSASLSFSQDQEDSATQTIYDFWRNGTEVSAQITLAHSSEATTGTAYSTVIQLPKCVFQGDGYESSEGAVIPETYNLMCLEHSTVGQAKITVVDSTSGTFTV